MRLAHVAPALLLLGLLPANVDQDGGIAIEPLQRPLIIVPPPPDPPAPRRTFEDVMRDVLR